ncbi:MAG: hypothetical protein KAX37_10820 [Opitutaceae bacterium]|nr:hypothetical protein [Opitutaceae bacterium]
MREVVRNAESVEDMGLNLAEFLDHINFLLRKKTSRTVLHAAIRGEPPPTGNSVHDAYLAAVAAHLANVHRLPRPPWVDKASRHLDRPWFAIPDPWARAWLLRDSPAAFRERNLFTTECAIQRV